MFPCQRVDLDFVDTAPFRFVSTVDLAITAEQVWEVLDDAESWPHWATVITKVTWTSPEPHGVGTTRVVNMRGGIVGDEEYLAWDPFSHMAFRFNEAVDAQHRGVRRGLSGCSDGRRLPSDVGHGDEAERRSGEARHVARSARDVVDVPEVPVQPSPLFEQALPHRGLVEVGPGLAALGVGILDHLVPGRQDDASEALIGVIDRPILSA